MEFMEEDLAEYVCITHQSIAPCEKGEFHLISNWKVDVLKIKELIDRNENI
jgi:hypothetical protein